MKVFRHFHPSGQPLALAIGNFDGVHRGHQQLLSKLAERAAAQGLCPAVMTFEPHPRELFSPQSAPSRLTSLREKLESFAALEIAEVYVCRFNRAFAAMTASQFVTSVLQPMRVQSLLIGDDFRFGAGREGNVDTLREHGLEVTRFPEISISGERVSSTAIRQALAAGDLIRARQMLGRHYSMSGHVAHGDKLGRQLGYPTANIHLRHAHTPLSGIYAVKLSGLAGPDLPGVASLGVRPTVKQGAKPLLEVHLFDFNRDIYGYHVRVHFLKKLRDEARFPSLAALQQQIKADAQAARNYFGNAFAAECPM